MGVYHSYSPNVYWYDDVERREKVFYALRGIGEGEELLYNYGGTNNIGEAYEF
jgi:SET domain-containing protein